MVAKRLPNEHEAAAGALIGATNAIGLLSDADRLASAGSYGAGRSLAVLAFEEAVKARTLGTIVMAAKQGGPVGFSDDQLREIIYRDHRTRHRAGFLQHLAAEHTSVYGKLMLGMAIDSAEAATVTKLVGLIASANAKSSRDSTWTSTRSRDRGHHPLK